MKQDNSGISDDQARRCWEARAKGLKTVLFICTGNAVRSQMAEALVNHFLKDKWAAFSAGFLPSGIHPLVKKVLREIGVGLSSQTSKHLDSLQGCRFDRLITLCSEADEVCTYYPGLSKKEHIPFQDPSLSLPLFFGGKTLFRKLRDEMKKILIPLLDED